ncbi:T cell receptor alpha chain MC.7.G5-like [Alexandromys fortis]|nr:T cell receptor alpha chain MC.7.G5-like [Microtus fortis]
MFPLTILLLGMFLSLRGNRAQSVVQPDAHLTVSEGASLELKCSYSYGATPYLFWYVQYPGQSLQLLLKSVARDTLIKGINGFEAEFVKSNSSFNLRKNPAHWSDSAKYFCALSDTAGKLTFGLGTKLSIKPSNNTGFKLIFGTGTRLLVDPNIQDPKPAVYQLRDAQAKNSTICLFTDFGSHVNKSEDVPPDVFVSKNTVLDMRSMDSKSNGAIAWSNHSSLNCKDTFGQNAFYPSSDVPCDARLIEKSFETDMNLNFQNLSVMGLRILLLKVAGFNLLMTLRLWSS